MTSSQFVFLIGMLGVIHIILNCLLLLREGSDSFLSIAAVELIAHNTAESCFLGHLTPIK